MEEETPVPKATLPVFPEPVEKRGPRKGAARLLMEAATQTEDSEAKWQEWLQRCLEGKGLVEHGVLVGDVAMAMAFLQEAGMKLPRGGAQARWKSRGSAPDPLCVLQQAMMEQGFQASLGMRSADVMVMGFLSAWVFGRTAFCSTVES